ncbi:10924_t:CDS:2 [Diversispora eburnea]|uniref:10924_t:CDS:1 n=1 Tax=Diversispora eburnea TaxID=1213867 RepID=A0A9N8V0X2_9GLOM|nr:10924_t:CDS:2 [Diversispora eburnea]
MDVEAKRKFCGLLMFDVPTVTNKTSRNNEVNDIPSTRDVDLSTLNNQNYDSRNSDICNQFISQDCILRSPDFNKSSGIVLSAGAAIGNDQITTNSTNVNNIDETSGKIQKRTPRPPNAFILYRRAKQPAIIAAHRHLTNAEVSRQISDMWKSEPEEVRLEWERYADRKKLEHMQTYPNYVYRPNKSKTKVDKRRQRKQTKDFSTPSPNTNDINDNLTSTNTDNFSGPVRRKSTRNASNKTISGKSIDSAVSQSTMNNGFNMQSSSSINMSNPNSRNNNMQSTPSYDISNPEIPLLTSHFTDNPEEFVNPSDQMHNASNFQFASINGLTSFHHAANGFPHHQTVDSLEYCFVPDVAQQQQQMIAEMMLHHDQHPHITPTGSVSSVSSNSCSPTSIQYLPQSNGNNISPSNNSIVSNTSFADMLAGFEYPNYMGGSVNHQHMGDGACSPNQYLQ